MNKKTHNNLYQLDLSRYTKISRYQKLFHRYLRKSQTCSCYLFKLYFRLRLKFLNQKNGLEISYNTCIGKGLYIGHPYNITINEKVIIGDNCNIHKGVLIGQENRGKRKGTPIIGNSVWIGINAVIVGNIRIGDDVLIAPNSYVNCDIPNHSIVFGNPCIIKHADSATQDYINRKV